LDRFAVKFFVRQVNRAAHAQFIVFLARENLDQLRALGGNAPDLINRSWMRACLSVGQGGKPPLL
jgi:hypothetical protein